MKRFLAIAMCLVLLLSTFASCKPANQGTNPSETTAAITPEQTPENTPNPPSENIPVGRVEIEVGAGAFYAGAEYEIHMNEQMLELALNRSELLENKAMHSLIYKCDSLEELHAFQTTHRLNHPALYDTDREGLSFQKQSEAFDAEFFLENTLLVVYQTSGSGSLLYGVERIIREGNSLCVYVECTNDEPDRDITHDCAAWLLAVPVRKADIAGVTDFDAIYNENIAIRYDLSWAGYTVADTWDLTVNREQLEDGSNQYPMYRCDSVEELNAFRERYQGVFNLQTKYDSIASFETVSASFTAEYFERYSLFIIYMKTGTTSYPNFRVKEITFVGDQLDLYVECEPIPLDTAVNGMAGGFMLSVTLPKYQIGHVRRFNAFSHAENDRKALVAWAGATTEDVSNMALNRDVLQNEDAVHLPVYRFSTQNELDAFKDAYADVLIFDQGKDEIQSFNHILTYYVGNNFDVHSELLIYVNAGNDSDRYQIDKVIRHGTSLCIYVKKQTTAEPITDVAGGWFLFLTFSHSYLKGIDSYDVILKS